MMNPPMDQSQIEANYYNPCEEPVSFDSAGSSDAAIKPILVDRYKTKMCRNYIETGVCPYEVRCMFAHGEHELRTPEMNLRDGLVSEEAIREFRRQWRIKSHLLPSNVRLVHHYHHHYYHYDDSNNNNNMIYPPRRRLRGAASIAGGFVHTPPPYGLPCSYPPAYEYDNEYSSGPSVYRNDPYSYDVLGPERMYSKPSLLSPPEYNDYSNDVNDASYFCPTMGNVCGTTVVEAEPFVYGYRLRYDGFEAEMAAAAEMATGAAAAMATGAAAAMASEEDFDVSTCGSSVGGDVGDGRQPSLSPNPPVKPHRSVKSGSSDHKEMESME